MVTAGLFLLLQATASQYPLAPSPVLDLRTLTHELRLAGYVSARQTWRRDTLTSIINRARLTAQVMPAPFAALRVQADFAATGFARADTVPAILLTDAYIELAPPATIGATGALAEGEFLARRGPFTSTTTVDASGGYVLGAYRIRPWLQPVVKWEHLRDRRTTGVTTSTTSLTYTTVGINVLSRGETIRALVDGIYKSEPAVFSGTELEVQLIAIF